MQFRDDLSTWFIKWATVEIETSIDRMQSINLINLGKWCIEIFLIHLTKHWFMEYYFAMRFLKKFQWNKWKILILSKICREILAMFCISKKAFKYQTIIFFLIIQQEIKQLSNNKIHNFKRLSFPVILLVNIKIKGKFHQKQKKKIK